jgi:hypothetical protein
MNKISRRLGDAAQYAAQQPGKLLLAALTALALTYASAYCRSADRHYREAMAANERIAFLNQLLDTARAKAHAPMRNSPGESKQEAEICRCTLQSLGYTNFGSLNPMQLRNKWILATNFTAAGAADFRATIQELIDRRSDANKCLSKRPTAVSAP